MNKEMVEKILKTLDEYGFCRGIDVTAVTLLLVYFLGLSLVSNLFFIIVFVYFAASIWNKMNNRSKK